MRKAELKELYQMMFPEYPDIVTVRQLREMLGNSFKIPKVSVINFVTEEQKEVKSSA